MSTLAPPVISHADERHIADMMTVMRASFDPGYGEAWSALQLGGSLAMSGAFARQAQDGQAAPIGFTLCRAAGPEVELLLIAVHPDGRGRGTGRALLEMAIADSRNRGASEIFLEVRENNHAARRLYLKAGFFDIGRRSDYYSGSFGARFAAITMKRSILLAN